MTAATIELRDALNVPDIRPRLIWTDIPFNTGKRQGTAAAGYFDAQPSHVLNALRAWSQILRTDGTMVVCCDYRMAWKVCKRLDHLIYMGEIIWEFGLGKPRETWWPNRHHSLLTFHRGNPKFDPAANPRVRRLAAKPGYPRDKPCGSVWEYTMSNTHPDRVGYPNQKPLEIIEPFIKAHTDEGDLIADPFCGSSTTGIAALINKREYYGSDSNPAAVEVSRQRLRKWLPTDSRI